MKKYLERGYAVDHGRLVKARKIELVLLDYLRSKEDRLAGKNIIDVGCGSGQIAVYFSEYNHVSAFDVIDQISPDIREKINFIKIENDLSSFPNSEFDIVILNHVLCQIKNKLELLIEINRLLKKNGICYISNPNRYYPVEPYYKIPFGIKFPKIASIISPTNIYILRKSG